MSFESKAQEDVKLERYKSLKQRSTNIASQLSAWKSEHENLMQSIGTLEVSSKQEAEAIEQSFIDQIKNIFGI